VREVWLVAGAGAGPWEWRLWLPVLRAAGLRPRPLALRPAPGGLAATRFEDYVDQLAAAAAASGAPPLLLGASMGALVCLAAAPRVRAAAVACVAGAPPAGTPGWPPQPRAFPDVVRWSEEATFEGTRRAMPEAPAWMARWALGRWRDESGAVLRAVFGGVALAPPPCPVLAVHGRADAQVPPACAESWTARWGADLLLVEGASHVGLLLGPHARRAAAATAAWLAARTGDTRPFRPGARRRPPQPPHGTNNFKI